MKPRHHLYLDDELTNELEHLASKPGASKSAIVTAALRQYLKHKGSDDRDAALRTRLDRLSRNQEQTQRDVDLIIETMTRFVRAYFMLTSHIPAPDDAGRAQARARIDSFTTEVGRAMAKRSDTRLPSGQEAVARATATAAE